MVKRLSSLMVFLALIFTAWLGGEPVIDASIDAMNAHAHYPLQGIITITHKKEETIDPKSFEIGGKPLEAYPVKEVLMSPASDTLVSIYQFQLPAEDAGLYVLPEISVKIGKQTFRSTSSSYEVSGTAPAPPTVSAPSPESPLIFKLEAKVIGPSTLYPGERTIFFYRISFNRSIDLTKSVLPMVHPAHFQKVGDVKIKDYQEGDVTIQELTQEVIAAETGTFEFGPSYIEGYPYTMKGSQKVYGNTLLQAKAPAITVEVKPFSQSGTPPSFTGSLGAIQAAVSLESPSKVTVGDTVHLQIKATGISNLEEMRLPILQCMPGFSGFFQMNDLPPSSEVEGDTKVFHVELRPISSLIQEIPPIELSSFNPSTGQYVVQKSEPIPLDVEPFPTKKKTLVSFPLIGPLPEKLDWPDPSLGPLPFEIEPVIAKGFSRRWLPSFSIFWLIPLGAILILLQARFAERIKQAMMIKRKASDELFHRAFRSRGFSFLCLLEESFWHRLWEKGVLEQGDHQLAHLPEIPSMQAVKSFIWQLQALQYSPEKEFDIDQIKKTAQQLYEVIERI